MSIQHINANALHLNRILIYISSLLLASIIAYTMAGASDSASIQGPQFPRQGDVVEYNVNPGDDADPIAVRWQVVPDSAGLITPDGRFVGYAPGPAGIVFQGRTPAHLDIEVMPRFSTTGSFEIVAHGPQTERFNSDLWVDGTVVYTGTWQGRSPETGVRLRGDRMFAWDVSDPWSPQRVAEIAADARTINDVKIRTDGSLAVITHEGSLDGLNGITLLGMQDPLRPAVITRFSDELTSGVHNVWIDGDFVYAAVDGPGLGLRIIDITGIADPDNQRIPFVTARFFGGPSFMHDVIVRDGLAFLSHWDDGLIILDVGNGIAGGAPQNPVEISRVSDLDGQTHNAWYWPEAGYVFVGEEDSLAPGIVHVVDVSDLFRPREVATFAVAGDTPHNFWLDETEGILYAAWYTRGLRAVDVNGELLGALDRQGREVAGIIYGSNAGCFTADGTCTWAPQLHDGLIYLSDLNTGLWILAPDIDLRP